MSGPDEDRVDREVDEKQPVDDESKDATPDSYGADSDDRAATSGEQEDGWRLFARDIAVSAVAVLLLGAYLFAISGVWPPLVAIESGSMEPNMEVNDLVFVMNTDRFQPAESTGDTGIVTAADGADEYTQFGDSGDVVVFAPNGDEERTPVIHRVMFWVEEGENWCESEHADTAHLGSLGANDPQCEAPHDGFITKGDDNPTYDQTGNSISEPVKAEWVIGTAELRIPGVGWFRLRV